MHHSHNSRTLSRRSASFGLGSVALAAMLHRNATAADWTRPDGQPHFPPRVRSVIWLFMNGGVSHMESFDPKPMLTGYAGRTIAETPFADVQNPQKLAIERLVVPDGNGNQRNTLYPLQIGFHAVTDRHYVTDVHATILKLLGLDSRRLEIPGRTRLEVDHGTPLDGILA